MSKISVNNDLVSHKFRAIDSDSSHGFPFIDEGLYRCAKSDVHTHLFGNFTHAGCDAAEASLGVEDSVFVLEEGENSEQRRCMERTHT